MLDPAQARIGVIGLGYVGLPLAVEFGKKLVTVGFDVNTQRIAELRQGNDRTLEVSAAELQAAERLSYSSDAGVLASCNVYIVTVPTPIDQHKRPDLAPLRSASETIGACLKQGDTVIYESTVYPGATEEVCVPVLEARSGMRMNEGFFVGYSPERINPGDRDHRLPTILKVTSGSTPAAADFVDRLYRQIITAGTHKTSSIRVAEAAKVIENTQRDVNIALVNELSLLFDKLGIDSLEVLEAAGTKWNFLPFRPGLVGGHCIGVDPYYLTHKAQEIGYHPQVILAGRHINDGMGAHVAERVIKLLTRRRIHVVGANILVMGLAFKEDCPDLRNTRVVDIIQELQSYHAHVEVLDPWVDPDEARSEYGVEMVTEAKPGHYDAIVLSVAHREFRELGVAGVRGLGKGNCVLFDVKGLFARSDVDDRL